MAWGESIEVNSIGALKTALENSRYDLIKLTADLNYVTEGQAACVNILRSVTIDGQGHKILDGGIRTGSTKTTLAINQGAPANENWIDSVVLKNITLQTSTFNQVLNCRGNITRLVIENSTIETTYNSGNNQAITFYSAEQTSPIKLIIKNSTVFANKAGYPVITWNPLEIETEGSTFNGFCCLYFKGPNGNDGSHNSEVKATNCHFYAANYHDGAWDSFGAFPIEDGGINLELDNCVVEVQEYGTSRQTMFLLSGWAQRTEEACAMTITGSNSHILGDFISSSWPALTSNISLVLKGGSYYGNDFEDAIADSHVSIAPGYHAEPVNQGGQEMYRVVQDAATHTETDPVTGDPVEVLYDLNDAVETTDKGENPATSFELSSGADMTLDNEVTTAGYVQIKDNATEGATTVTVGQTTGGENQTLIINEGLDVQGNSQVVVETGATLQIGEGGIVTEKPENIVIEADENGAASLIMDPAITVNQTPNLTVKMQAKQIGWLDFVGEKYYFWHRFALPIQEASTWVKTPNKPTYVFGWSYTANDWEQLSALTQMKPFKGYTLSADYENLGDVEYTFKGQLAGNTNNPLEFQRNGFNFFGNSYTGYIDILALVDQIMGDNKIDGSVWVWGSDQNYHAVPLQTLRDGGDVYATEIAPMQTFIMKQNGGENATAQLNYEAAVWNNPRYGNAPTPAPARALATDETTHMRIIVTADNGKSDFVMFTEEDRFSDAYEKGYDAVKYMNERAINMYSTIDGEDYSNVATDNLMGKKLNIQTVNTLNYTISFAKVSGEEYALRDNVTGSVVAIEEGVTYAFSAQPNATIGGRFEIVGRNMVVTGVENIENNADAKGIYTVLGQYVGEDFNALPAGMYIVNGVKIIK